MEIFVASLVAISIFLLLMPKGSLRHKNIYKEFTTNELTKIQYQEIENKRLKKLLQMAYKIDSVISLSFLPVNKERLKKELTLAGLNKVISYHDIIALKKLSAFICLSIFTFYFIVAPSTLMMILVVGVTIMGYYVPDNIIHGRATKRQWKIQKELPSTLTNLAIITDAGLNLFQAIETLSKSNNGELSKELRITVEDINLGMSQQEAFERFAERCSIEEVHYFISALLQGLKKGNSGLTQIIRGQADESWDKRKKKAKELGGKASIKLFLPLLLLVFPAFVIFLMGPMMFSLIEFFK